MNDIIPSLHTAEAMEQKLLCTHSFEKSGPTSDSPRNSKALNNEENTLMGSESFDM